MMLSILHTSYLCMYTMSVWLKMEAEFEIISTNHRWFTRKFEFSKSMPTTLSSCTARKESNLYFSLSSSHSTVLSVYQLWKRLHHHPLRTSTSIKNTRIILEKQVRRAVWGKDLLWKNQQRNHHHNRLSQLMLATNIHLQLKMLWVHVQPIVGNLHVLPMCKYSLDHLLYGKALRLRSLWYLCPALQRGI